MTTPDDIVAAARCYLGVPWRHQGRDARGLDCAGLVVVVARELGLTDYDATGYGRHALGQAFVDHFRAAMDPVPVSAMRPGDVPVFADSVYPCHCGVISLRHDVLHLIHAHALRRRVIEEPYAGEWPLKIKFVFRFRGLNAA